MSNKILFFGNERLATGLSTTVPILSTLLNNGYEVEGIVVAQHDLKPTRKERDLEIVGVAQSNNIPMLTINKLKDAEQELKDFDAEVAILIAYGKIVPQSIINIFPRGIINIHPSLLPLHRGPTPIESVILNGDSQTGVSLMQLSSKMDAGPIYVQQNVKLLGTESKQELANQLSLLGSEMLVKYLPDILNGSLKAITQSDINVTYDKLISKDDGIINWHKPARSLEREVRAYAIWPRSRTRIGQTEIIITQAHVVLNTTPGIQKKKWACNQLLNSNSTGLIVETTPQTLGFMTSEDVLMIDRLIPAGKKEMTTQAFLAGYRP
jgi:methionyl-tRNA formyltransferase